MGWFWGPSGQDDNSKSQDPLRDLDPGLREFLAKESPLKYRSENPPTASQCSAAPQAQKVQAPLERKYPDHTPSGKDDEEGKAPPQSLFKDGRYAHLWTTYQSQADVDAVGKSDQEKINDVLEGYKYRKAEIGRAALENCALEQWDVNECFRSGGWASQMTMCRAENRQLERCYLMQAKFLKALGYLSTFDRPAEVDEKIQMHADTLYHRMLDQEKAIEAAKAEGKPVPSFPPLLSPPKSNIAKGTGTPGSQIAEKNKGKPSDLPASVQAQLKKRLDGLNDEEREVEERAIKAEIQAGEQLAGQLGTIYQKQQDERRRRKEQGRETIGDKLSSMFGFW
jgi:hypothetical protein